jgi:hypothetical protein
MMWRTAAPSRISARSFAEAQSELRIPLIGITWFMVESDRRLEVAPHDRTPLRADVSTVSKNMTRRRTTAQQSMSWAGHLAVALPGLVRRMRSRLLGEAR